MDTLGKLFVDKRFAEYWTKYRGGEVGYINDIPFLHYYKRFPLILIVHSNHNYKTSILFQAVKKAVENKVALLRFISDDYLDLNGCKHKTHYTLIIDLTKSIDDIFSSLKKSTKQRIRRADLNNLKLKICDNTSEFNDWWDNNYLKWAKGKKYAVESYEFIKAVFQEPDLSRLFLAYLDNKIIAGLFVIFSSDERGFIWISSHDINYIDYCPDHFLQWEVIKWLKNNKFRVCDFGGLEHSKIFKEGFSREVSTWHSYDFKFDPMISNSLELFHKIKFNILRRY